MTPVQVRTATSLSGRGVRRTEGEDIDSRTGDPVMLEHDSGRLITVGAVRARLLVAHDHPSYAATFEMTVAPGFDVGAQVHGDAEEIFVPHRDASLQPPIWLENPQV